MTVPIAGLDADREVRDLELGTRRLVRNLLAGDYAAAFKGRGVEFADVREYVPGDDVRTIDWRVSARLGVTHVRRYQEERELSIMLVVDASASGDVGSRRRTKRELAAHVAAVFGLAAARGNDRIGAVLFTDRVEKVIEARKGRRHALRVVRELLAFAPAGRGTDLARALDGMEGSLGRRATVLVMSDFLSPDIEPALRRLAARHDVVAVLLVDGAERELPDVGLIHLADPESGELLLLDTSDPRIRALYAERQRGALAARERLLRQSGADVLLLDAAEGVAEPMLTFFRRRATRR